MTAFHPTPRGVSVKLRAPAIIVSMTTPLRILAIPGSLRARSTNLLLLETAALLATRRYTNSKSSPSLGDIPPFNPDRHRHAPTPSRRSRHPSSAADAVIFSTPEYAHGLPGALKNALDWLVSGIEFTDKPVVLFNASARSVYAQAALREVLVTLGARILDDACVTVPLTRRLAHAAAARRRSRHRRTHHRRASAPRRQHAGHRAANAATASQPTRPRIAALAAAPASGAPQLPRPLLRNRAARSPASHAEPLYTSLCNAFRRSRSGPIFSANPPAGMDEWRSRLEKYAASRDPLFFTLFDETGRAAGICAYLRIAPEHGSIEIGHIHLSPQLQQTRAATEIQYLLMRHAFDDLGYRRYEWKCDALNAPSRRAALRLGFRFEGIFLNAIVYKQRSRDTAWFSITDDEWPQVRRGFEAWLAPENFDAEGRQLSLTRQPAGTGVIAHSDSDKM